MDILGRILGGLVGLIGGLMVDFVLIQIMGVTGVSLVLWSPPVILMVIGFFAEEIAEMSKGLK